MPHLARIDLYPFKSLDGITVEKAKVLESGALAHDREYAFFDSKGGVVNGKRNAQIYGLRSQICNTFQTLTLQAGETDPQSFHIAEDRNTLNTWLSHYFEQDIQVRQNVTRGFPDDTDSPGPTIISTATLELVASWYPDLTLEDLRRRLRTNLEIDGVSPFWEDQLFADTTQHIQFQIGTVTLEGVNPCQRCIVPTRNPESGIATPQFQRTFVKHRQQSLPDWVNPARFNHFYRLAVNTRIPNALNQTLTLGDEVVIKGVVED